MKQSKKNGFLAALLAVMLIAVMMLTLAACNESEQNSTTTPLTQGQTEGTTTSPTQEQTEGTTTPPTEGETEGATTSPTEGETESTTTPPTEGETEGATTPPTEGETEGTTTPPTQGETVKKPTSVSQYKSEGNYPTIKGDMLSWDYLNSVPIKTANMDITEARKICVDFFRVSKSALWIPDTDWKAVNSSGKVLRTMDGGKIYAGLPYATVSKGNIYRLMDYLDPETGVVDVTAAGKNHELFANQCSFASYWGWGRVINSAKFTWTSDMVMRNGYIRVGPYTYDDDIAGLYPDNLTKDIVKANGEKTMYESYAELKAGDGISRYNSGGHVVMIAQDAHVEYKADGSIDPDKSYVYIIDQAGDWKNGTNAQGDKFIFAAHTDKKWTFDTLYSGNYIPFTFKEWLGTDPIEETQITYSHTGNTISEKQLWGSKITCNYGLSDLYAVIKDKDGNEVYKLAVRATKFLQKTMTFSKDNKDNVIWGSWATLDKNKEYTVEIIAQIATGERPTLWTGKLVQ